MDGATVERRTPAFSDMFGSASSPPRHRPTPRGSVYTSPFSDLSTASPSPTASLLRPSVHRPVSKTTSMRPTGQSSRRSAVAAVASSLALLSLPAPPALALFDDVSPLAMVPPGSRLAIGLEEAMRPKVKALPRRRMERDFAVLLMRTSYAIADDLDFMPMYVAGAQWMARMHANVPQSSRASRALRSLLWQE